MNSKIKHTHERKEITIAISFNNRATNSSNWFWPVVTIIISNLKFKHRQTTVTNKIKKKEGEGEEEENTTSIYLTHTRQPIH